MTKCGIILYKNILLLINNEIFLMRRDEKWGELVTSISENTKKVDFFVSDSDKSPHNYYGRIESLVEYLRDLHISFSQEVRDLVQLNLKRTKIYNLFLEEQQGVISEYYYKRILSYIEKLNELYMFLELEYLYKDLDLSMRVKERGSITDKLNHYCYRKEQQGKIPLNKCLNDLFGVRVILNGFDHSCEYFLRLCAEFSNQDEYKIKVTNASKNGYVATHIYFQGVRGDNFSFPWELQIWSKSDEKKNLDSHYKHKQSYKEWPEKYKKSTNLEMRGGC